MLTYRWIDELQAAAFKTLGSIAGRAIGYLAPEVALGGAIVSAGLIETDSLDRDGVAAYLNELADSHPELMDHITDGGGLLEGLQMRSMLTAGYHGGRQRAAAARGGLRAIGVDSLPGRRHVRAARRGGGFVRVTTEDAGRRRRRRRRLPASIEELMVKLTSADRRISVQRIGAGRYIAYLPGNLAHEGGRLRIVGGDTATYVRQVVRAIEQAVEARPQEPA